MNNDVKKGELCPTCHRYNDRHMVCDGIIVENGKILLGLRDLEPEKGKWALFGGYLNWDETIEEAVIREVKEETGLTTKIIEFLGIYSNPKRDTGDQNVSVAYVLKRIGNDKLVPQPGEMKELKWFDLNNLPALAFDHDKIMGDYKNSLK